MQKPVSHTLPANLPNDWKDTQYVSPGGVEVGLTEQHGYNYMNEQINAAHRAINLLNNAFGQVLAIEGANKTIMLTGINAAPRSDQPGDYPEGVYLYLQTPDGQLQNTPSAYGLILSLKHNDELSQLWFTQAAGTTYRRSGNHLGWASGWVPLSGGVVSATLE